jgi:hypothetical protein
LPDILFFTSGALPGLRRFDSSVSLPKYLYRNKHDGTFEDDGYLSGFALNDEGREQAAMGIAVGDYNCLSVQTRLPMPAAGAAGGGAR